MSIAILTGRLILAAVPTAAGVGKATARPAFRAAVVAFGVPERYASGVAVTLPIVELAAALALLPSRTAEWGAAVTAVLMVTFCAAVARVLHRGDQPDCHCFGKLSAAPVSRITLCRNLGLTALSGFVLVAGLSYPEPSAVAWATRPNAAAQIGRGAAAVIAATFAFQAWFSLQLLRQNGRILERLQSIESAGTPPQTPAPRPGTEPSTRQGLPFGTLAPAFSLSNLAGEGVTLSDLLAARRKVLLLFADSQCGPCRVGLGPQALVGDSPNGPGPSTHDTGHQPSYSSPGRWTAELTQESRPCRIRGSKVIPAQNYLVS